METGKALSLIDATHTPHPEAGHLRRSATYASVAVALALIVAKLIAYFMTDSVAMLSSLLDSTIDLVASLITMFSVASALQPPDREHRYGHGKAEPLAALVQAAFIVGSSVLLGFESLHRLYHPHEIQNETLGYVVMAFAVVLTILLIGYQRFVISHTRSMAIGADFIHYIGDLAVNIAVVLAFAAYQLTGHLWFDPLFAIAVATGMSFNAFRIAAEALNVLMDHELPDQDRQKIKSVVLAQAQVRGLHDLRTRSDGERVFIEFHLELDPDMTLRAAHKIDESIMSVLRKEFPASDIIIHQDPDGIHEVRLDEKIARDEKRT